MALKIDTSSLFNIKPPRFWSNCEITNLDILGVGSTVTPRLIEVRLPDLDGGLAEAMYYGGFTLVVGNFVQLRRDTIDSVYTAIGPGGSDALDSLDNIKNIIFNTNPTGIVHTEGQLSWHTEDKTLSVDSGFDDVSVQVGLETQFIVYNATAGTLLNGRVTHPVSVFQGRPTAEYARSNSFETINGTIGILTMDISPGEFGVVTIQGKVRSLDTSMFSLGQIWVSSTSTTGELTQTKPEFPNYDMSIGAVTVVDAVDGEITVSIINKASDTFDNAWNGTIRESFDFRVSSAGGIITGSLTPTDIDPNNPDLTMIFSDGFSTLDTDPAVTITLTAGTDVAPATNRIYIPKSTKVLTVTTSDWPTGEIIRIAVVLLPSASRVQTDDALINVNFNEHLQDVGGIGHVPHIGQKIRRLGASWASGVTPSTSGLPTNVFFAVTSGVVWQLHEQTFPAKDMAVSDWAYVINHPTVAYTRITNFNTQTLDANGDSLANRSFSVVLWGSQNKSGEESQLFLNLPIGSYHKNNPENAVEDSDSFTVYSFPTEYEASGFLIARFIFTLDAGGTSWVLFATEDLRGQVPSTSAGGGGAVSIWQVDTNGINYQLGNVGIGIDSEAANNLLVFDAATAQQTIRGGASGDAILLLQATNGFDSVSLTMASTAQQFSIGTTRDIVIDAGTFIQFKIGNLAKLNFQIDMGLSIAGDLLYNTGQYLQLGGTDQKFTDGSNQGVGINAFPQNTANRGVLFLNYTTTNPTQNTHIYFQRHLRLTQSANTDISNLANRSSEGSNLFRNALLFDGVADIIALRSQAPNGKVEIRANNATGGGGGEAVIGTFKRVSQGDVLNLPGLPTSATGLVSGDLWNNSNVVNIV